MGFVGLGMRGPGAVERFTYIPVSYTHLEKIKEVNGIIAFCSDKLTKADKEIEKLLSEKWESEE